MLARGALASAAVAPAVAPWANGRVGLDNHLEAGLTYTGRSVRLDGRRAFEWGRVALSIGVGGSALLPGSVDDRTAGATYMTIAEQRGWGLDLPVLIGWQDKDGILTVWAGPRAGFEKLAAAATFALDAPVRTTNVSATRGYVGPVVGLAVGFRHVHAAAEMAAYYQSVRGTGLGLSTELSAVSLVPATGLEITF
jgi:hypothetical protein